MENKNFIKLSNSIYIANNQNGFNQAVYDFFGHNDNELPIYHTKKELRSMNYNYPHYDKSGNHPYPCMFAIVDDTFNQGRYYIDIIPKNTLNKILNDERYKNL